MHTIIMYHTFLSFLLKTAQNRINCTLICSSTKKRVHLFVNLFFFCTQTFNNKKQILINHTREKPELTIAFYRILP